MKSYFRYVLENLEKKSTINKIIILKSPKKKCEDTHIFRMALAYLVYFSFIF